MCRNWSPHSSCMTQRGGKNYYYHHHRHRHQKRAGKRARESYMRRNMHVAQLSSRCSWCCVHVHAFMYASEYVSVVRKKEGFESSNQGPLFALFFPTAPLLFPHSPGTHTHTHTHIYVHRLVWHGRHTHIGKERERQRALKRLFRKP